MKRALSAFAVASLMLLALPAPAAQKFIVAQQDHSAATPRAVAHKTPELSCEPAESASELDLYLGEHFDSLQGAPLAFPAHALNKLKAVTGPMS